MVIIKPLKVLVCLLIASAFLTPPHVPAYNGTDLLGGAGVQGEALSADPRPQAGPALRTRTTAPMPILQPIGNPVPAASSRAVSGPLQTMPYAACPPTGFPSSGSGFPGPPAQQFGMFGPLGMGFGGGCGDYLPRPGAKQFQGVARLWYARVDSSTILWGTNLAGGPGTELDLLRDLNVGKYEYVPEYEGRCQIRCNWGLRFAFMPLMFRDNTVPLNPFFFGNSVYAAGLPILTKWDRFIYRWDVVYDWFQAKHAVSSIFAGYALYDDKFTISNAAQSRSRSNTFGLAFAGGSIDRIVRNVGAGTASVHCKFSVQFLEGYFGWDGTAMGRVAVPMACGRFGYFEAGWRWMVLERSYPSNKDKTSFDGLQGAVGLIF